MADLIETWRGSWQQKTEVGMVADDGVADEPQSGDLQSNGDRTNGDRIVIGTREDDQLAGNDQDQVILALSGDDGAEGGGGNDWIAGGFGNDMIDGGPGNDKAFGHWGDDHFHYDAAENEGSRDYYNGGAGNDTLKLHVSQEIYDSEWFQEDLAAFGERSAWQTFRPFRFEELGLTVHRIEDIEVYVDGELIEDAIPADEPEANAGSNVLERFAGWLPPTFWDRFDHLSGSSDTGSWLT